MNTLEMLKVKSPTQKKVCVQFQTLGTDSSRVARRKIPQTRLSYLKQLFSKNFNINQNQNITGLRLQQQQKKAFKKSKVMLHSTKNLQRLQIREIPIRERYKNQLHDDGQDIINRDNKGNDRCQQILPQITKQQKIYNNIIKQNNVGQTIKSSIQKKSRFLHRNRKSQSDITLKNNFHENHSLIMPKQSLSMLKQYSTIPKQSLYSKEKITNHSVVINRNQKIVKKQIKELKKIGRLLQDIKYQILKNRSMIIQGIKQINYLDQKYLNKTRYSKVGKIQNKSQYSKVNQDQCFNVQITKNRHERNTVGPKPIVQYQNVYKIR